MARKFVFSGKVQGVGFRATSVRCAQGLFVQGYVRNLADGRVEMVADGNEEHVDELVRRIRNQMGLHIQSFEVVEIPAQNLEGFSIAYDS